MEFYGEDLAHVHDTGFNAFAHKAAKMIIKTLKAMLPKAMLPKKGLIIDLGCGSGIVAKNLVQAGYDVLGIDLSPSLIAIAKREVAEAKFICSSFFDIELPKCMGVISTSECFNYISKDNHLKSLELLFGKIYQSLEKDGVLIFDMLEPGEFQDNSRIFEKEDWTMFVHTLRDPTQGKLTREITLFKKTGDLYRKTKEVHEANLYPRQQIIQLLVSQGFNVQTFQSKDDFCLKEGHIGYICQK
jgi:SAM-dependent methyltransferase